MEFSALAHSLALYLTPFLPYLVKAGEKAAEEAGKKFGEDAWSKARGIWGKLRPRVDSKPAALEAAVDVADSPQDADAQASLRLQIKKILSEEPQIANELEQLLKTQTPSIQVNVTGKSNVGVGGDAVNSLIIAGDANAIGNNNEISVTKADAVTYGVTLADFNELLAQLRQELVSLNAHDRVRDVIDADFEVIAAEANIEKPSLPVIETKLKSIESIVESTAGIGSSAMTFVPLIQKALEYAQVIFR